MAAVSVNFANPFSYLSFSSSIFYFFFASIDLNNDINSKNDFGVTYIYLLSKSKISYAS